MLHGPPLREAAGHLRPRRRALCGRPTSAWGLQRRAGPDVSQATGVGPREPALLHSSRAANALVFVVPGPASELLDGFVGRATGELRGVRPRKKRRDREFQNPKL